MRKKLLRSRSGFEKPESREEAIMQNILGASNVLEPSESNIEEILKSILYNTPYTKEAEFEIEKILLAIKNNGTYDGECESRDMKILFAILKDLDYAEKAESRIEELFIEWLNQRSKVKVLEGVPPLTFIAKGEPLINYEISGNTVQSGTPTPDNPIMPQGTGERTGNLYNINAKDVNNGYVNNAQLSQDGTTATWGSAEISEYIPISGDTTYTFNGIGSYNSPCYGLYDENKRLIGAYKYNGRSTINFTSPNNARYFRFTHIKTNAQAMMVEGTYTSSTMPEFEPYGYKIPILSANTTTPVYLGEVESTRLIKKLVLDGTESWRAGTENFYIFITSQGVPYSSAICTHAKNSSINNNGIALWMKKADFPDTPTVADFKSYLAAQYAAGTPVTVWYVLATEETAVGNEPLMKIGDYADSISMEQTGIEIPTINGSNTFDVNTSVKPSNVYIEYK